MSVFPLGRPTLPDESRPGPRAQGSQDSWSNPRPLVPDCESPGSVGRLPGHSGTGPCFPGQLVEPAGHWGRARGDGRAGRPRGPSETGPRHPGALGNPAGLPTCASVARQIRSTSRAIGPWTESPGRAGRHHGPESPGTSGRHPRATETGVSRPGQHVHHAVPWTQARDSRESWSTPRAFGHGRVSSGISG